MHEPHNVLQEYLDKEAQAYLIREGDLPPGIRANLAKELRRTLTACAAYIPGRLVHRQLLDPMPGRVSGTFWDGSILFADLSGFTSLSEQLSILGKQGAEEVSGVVNQLFNALVDEVLKHQGMLLKFGGDALTAFFDFETLGSTHAVAATLAALAMQDRMKAFSALKTRKGTFRLQLRVGVHSGKVFAAEVGDKSHIELVITGSEVNRVATAQEIAAPGEVVISDYTADLLVAATLSPRGAGFQHVKALTPIDLPTPNPDPIPLDGLDDMRTLITLAKQVNGLRPYLVSGLPGRFLDYTIFEMGEFRPVTVIFANFHDFSAILSHLYDNVVWAVAILNAYFQRAQQVVHQYGGIVNKVDMYTHGDKLMALFGAPTAHEDDPLRAVRCALDLKMALEEANEEVADLLKSLLERLQGSEHLAQQTPHDDQAKYTDLANFRFQQRIGINTGTVFAGRVGGVRRYEYTVMGSTVNLSARLMSATNDDTVLLSPATYAAVERHIAAEKQPPLRLKGLAAPVEPFRALHKLDVERASSQQAAKGIVRASLVGRDSTLNRLMQEATIALKGKGKIIALVGEAGIGKSRLAEELVRQLAMASFLHNTAEHIPQFQMYNNDCQSYEQSIPYATIRVPLLHILGVNIGQQNELIIHHIDKVVGKLAPDMQRFMPLLGDVLGIPIPDTPLTDSLDAEQRHDRVQELIVDIFLGATRTEPLLLSLEDIHWADNSSRELLNRLSQAAEKIPLLLILTYRPEPPIPEPWNNLPSTIRLTLSELSQDESMELLQSLLNGPPPHEILPLIERTQGNPFFIEELVNTLVVSHILAYDGTWKLTRPLDQISVPTSIEGLIVARLDRLDEPVYELVQLASVVGRRFSRSILEYVSCDTTHLDERLALLIEADMIVQDEKEQTSYLFRHALLRDVAYESILYSRRRELHRRVAKSIEQTTSLYLDENLTLLAQHYLLAEEWVHAFHYHREAGVRAQKRYANREALKLFAQAIEVGSHLQQEPTEMLENIEQYAGELHSEVCSLLPFALQIAEMYERSGYIYALLGEGDQAETFYLNALQLVQQLNDQQELNLKKEQHRSLTHIQLARSSVRIHRHLAEIYEQYGNAEQAFTWLEHGMRQSTSYAREEMARCYLLGARIYYTQAKFVHALEWANMAFEYARKMNNAADQALALKRKAVIYCEQGDFHQAILVQEEACKLFHQANILSGLNDALNDLGLMYSKVGRWQESINFYGQSLQMSENIGDIHAMARTSNNLALVLMARGELQQANQLYEYSCEQFRRIKSEQGIAYTTLNRGEVLTLQGKPQEAMELFRESIEILERINSRIDLPEVLRLMAEAMADLGDMEQASMYAQQSLDIACELGMALEEATAKRALGRIALQQNDFATAADYLEKSRALLEQLGERYQFGKVLYWQAKLAYAQGMKHEAITILQQTEEIFQELDAQFDLTLVKAFTSKIQAML